MRRETLTRPFLRASTSSLREHAVRSAKGLSRRVRKEGKKKERENEKNRESFAISIFDGSVSPGRSTSADGLLHRKLLISRERGARQYTRAICISLSLAS